MKSIKKPFTGPSVDQAIKRRDFLRGSIKAVLGAGLVGSQLTPSPLNLLIRPAMAQSAPAPTLVVIFQRGGCDGLNTVIPYGDDDYYALRPTIAVTPPDPADPDSALDLDGFFGLHPGLAGLKGIFDQGDLAVMPAVQYPDYSRSHFDSQNFIESGVREDNRDGWLNRYLNSSDGASAAGQLRAVNFGGSLAQSLRGPVPVSSFSSIAAFNLGLADTEERELVDTVLPVYQQARQDDHYRDLVREFGLVQFNNLDIARSIDTAGYQPANAAQYPDNSYGRQLREVAQLIKQGVGLEVATVSVGGWDTHSNQGGGEADGRQARNFRNFGDGVAALYTDLGAAMDNVVILTMTEFGRTAHENGSFGTDHGVASAWFAVGNRINGGVYNPGGWPGLAADKMIQGRFLDFNIDYRNILAELLQNHLGNSDLASILPGHSPVPLGLLA